jgi:uncharacterized phage-associated protein
MASNELGTKKISMAMPLPVLTAAKLLCERSGWTLTNLQLQKIMYLAQMFHLGQKNSRLVNGDFEAWDYGPVLPTVYSQAKIYGGGPIREIYGSGAIFDTERSRLLSDAYDQLGNLSAGRLVSITHWKEGAWAQYYQPNVRGIKIPDEAIINEYHAHAREQQQRSAKLP